jgi:anti-sigma B factor antagonist
MPLELHQREHESVTIIDLKGRLTVGDEASQFREYMSKALAAGAQNTILNMQGIDYVDSTGLGALVMVFTTQQKAGGKIKLLNLARRQIELLVMTKLATVFEIFDDEQDAVNSFFPDRKLKKFDILNFVKAMKEE